MEFHSTFRIVAERYERLGLPSNIEVPILNRVVSFPKWEGERPVSDWNRKPVIGPPERPFSELAILSFYENQGWSGAWVYRPNKFMSSWEPRGFSTVPPYALDAYRQLQEVSGEDKGCWDIFCWLDGGFLFAESKWPGLGDTIRQSQLAWLEAALEMGISKDAFVVVECTISSEV